MICQTEIGPELCAKSGQQDCGEWLNCNADVCRFCKRDCPKQYLKIF